MWDQTLGDRKGCCTSMLLRSKSSQAVCKHTHRAHLYVHTHHIYAYMYMDTTELTDMHTDNTHGLILLPLWSE